MQIVYDREETISAKEKIGKNNMVMEVWRRNYAPKTSIGNMTNLCRLLKPSSEKDFCEKYFEYAENHKELPVKQRGLTESEFVDMARHYMEEANKASGCEYPFELYLNDALCHTITQTYTGQYCEMLFRKFLEGMGYECGVVDGEEDAYYGIDVVVKKDGETLFFIQVKPLSFFKSNKEHVSKDRINLCYKYEKTRKTFGLKTYYVIHSVDQDTNEVTWLKNGDKFMFKIKDLFGYDKDDIKGTFTRKQLPIIQEKLPI